MNNQSQPQQQVITLAEINRQLTNANLPILSKQRAADLVRHAPRERLIDAVFKAGNNNPAARAYLVDLFGKLEGFTKLGGQSQPQQQRQQPSQTQAQGESAQTYGESVHVYGGKSALCFQEDETKNGFPTISIDGATATAPRSYDWANKIRVQLTRQELPSVAAVLVGAQPKCNFSSHGPQKDKGFELERQEGGKVYVKVFGGNGQGMRGVPVMPSDLFYVTSLVLRQLLKSMPGASINDVLAIVWATQSVPNR